MALSNKLGGLVLTTGNKSEMATGYSTLYGDMAGGFSVIKDVPKMLVYALARDRNERAGRALIPEAVLEKPPSAELRPDQKDSDSLPEYARARSDHRGLRGRRPLDRGARGRGLRRRDGAPGRAPRRPQRVQAPPSAPRRARVAEGVRQGPPPADHQPLARLNAHTSCAPASRGFEPKAALVLAALLYGVTFPLVKDALDDITPFAYLVGRFAIATLVVVPSFLRALRPPSPPVDRRLLLRAGVIAGVLLFGGYAAQTVGLQFTSASTSAFVTGLYVMITPIIEAVIRRRLPGRRRAGRRRGRDARAVPAHGRLARSRAR